jgi:uncharacterized membrane protein YkvA (DUF1232 family)
MAPDARDPLDLFPEWLRSLGTDVKQLAQALCDDRLDSEARIWIAGALNHLLKSVDLIPDGVEDLGYMDDAFVLRRSVAEVVKQGAAAAEHHPVIARLSAESADVDAFLEDDAPRLGEYVSGLRIATVRGRSPSAIVEDAQLAAQVAEDAASWAESYACPTFFRDEKTLVKLKAFLSTKLP